jgi:non-specific serine/threonine protein kinase/serine/threonine-protein kinase
MALDLKRVRAVFLAAAEHPDLAVRAGFLDHECAADVELRRRVEALLQVHDQPVDSDGPAAEPRRDATRDYAATPPGVTASTGDRVVALPIKEGPGTRIGPYTLLQLIGEGGMGTVYMAEQEKPVRRRVALKVIKPGMDSAPVIARFEAERQALALMDHPSIARVLDAGATDGDRPYFVMELVHGIPITHYCDEAGLTPRERLELFIPVCQAVQHAHQKGIIHRDLKPSNVLVTLCDGKPLPKVIDFGIAKATDQRLTERTMLTEIGSIMGTLEYMSPEQAGMNATGVDTRSDIYSLGVMLYELMTGTTPLERSRLNKAGYVEVLMRMMEEDTPKPSTRLSESKDALAAISARRKTEAAKLSRFMRGEIDWIVMKALEKDRSRRYETANGFARDIWRYLDGDPVEACPPSASYRLRKFAGKHRTALAAASAFAALLVLGIVLSTWQAIRATRAEAQANRSAAESRAVLNFFEHQVLAAARPEGQDGGLGTEVTVRKAVDAAESKIAAAFSDQPAVEASVRYVLGSTYRRLGEQPLAIPQLERARLLRTATLGPDHPETLSVQNELALAYWGNGQLSRVIPLIERTLAAQKARLGPDHPDTIISQNDLGVAYQEGGRLDLAIPLLEKTLAAEKVKLGPDHIETLNTQGNLGIAYREAGLLNRAIALLERTLSVEGESAQLGPGHPNTLGAQYNLALCYQADGQLERAISLIERTLTAQAARLGPDHPRTLITQNGLARAYEEAGDEARAEPLFRKVLALREARRGPGHPHVAVTLDDLGQFLLQRKRYDEAEPLLRECLKIREEMLPDDWNCFHTQNLLGGSLLGQKKYDEAEPFLISGYEGMKARETRIPAQSRPRLKAACERVVQLYESTGRKEMATEWRAKLTTRSIEATPRP